MVSLSPSDLIHSHNVLFLSHPLFWFILATFPSSPLCSDSFSQRSHSLSLLIWFILSTFSFSPLCSDSFSQRSHSLSPPIWFILSTFPLSRFWSDSFSQHSHSLPFVLIHSLNVLILSRLRSDSFSQRSHSLTSDLVHSFDVLIVMFPTLSTCLFGNCFALYCIICVLKWCSIFPASVKSAVVSYFCLFVLLLSHLFSVGFFPSQMFLFSFTLHS